MTESAANTSQLTSVRAGTALTVTAGDGLGEGLIPKSEHPAREANIKNKANLSIIRSFRFGLQLQY
jgi:hypothetical protein